MRGVVVLMDRARGRDRVVARLLDGPWMSGVTSGEWEISDLVEALHVAMRRSPDRLVAAVSLTDACRRLMEGEGLVRVQRAHAHEGLRRIRLRS